ncbi:hypothetical protein K432DRAFT_191025 [Lepidopterella palustris CBS 459.81]|uniref:Transcription factor domain-containing protein n=1 Tax=Lepidopterella palustris CBS 459.81 TaxID=1314670 RepID=A0A8E2JIG8_9PEZI|nr:hypothetical protein K432DRAFT_191025 [Lepidopterella palustris CBS 459.81]
MPSSLFCFHQSRTRAECRALALEHGTYSIKLLDESSVNPDLETMAPEAAIAAALVLSVSESYRESYISTGRSFVRHAECLLVRAKSRWDRLSNDDLSKSMFLFSSWLYMDVITGLTTTGKANHHDLEGLVFSSITSPNISHPDSADGHPTGQLMGCVLTLFPIMGQTIKLAKSIQASEGISNELIKSAKRMEAVLREWLPHMPSDDTHHDSFSVSYSRLRSLCGSLQMGYTSGSLSSCPSHIT